MQGELDCLVGRLASDDESSRDRWQRPWEHAMHDFNVASLKHLRLVVEDLRSAHHDIVVAAMPERMSLLARKLEQLIAQRECGATQVSETRSRIILETRRSG
jgi:hypothetical protein